MLFREGDSSPLEEKAVHGLASFYHAHPIMWTLGAAWLAYEYGKNEGQKALAQWHEWHRKIFNCHRRPGNRR